MGIRGLLQLIKDIAGTAAIRSYKFSKFREMATIINQNGQPEFIGITVPVDASSMIYQIGIAMRSSGEDLRNKEGELTSHLLGIFYKILIFVQHGIIPIIVFDGKAPEIKNVTLEKRRAKKDLAEKKLKEITDTTSPEYIKYFKQTFSPSKRDIIEAQILLDLMGVPHIEAPGEADVVCAWLTTRCDSQGRRYAIAVCSDDSDMLVFGAPYLLKDMLHAGSKNKRVKVVSLNGTLVKMNLTMDQFQDLCVLMGTDYCDNIKAIASKTAYKMISTWGSLEAVFKMLNVEGKSKDTNIKKTQQCMFEARKYFKNALDELDNSKEFIVTEDQLSLRQFQYKALMDFMCTKHNFSVERIHRGLERLKEYYNKLGVTRQNTKMVHKLSQPFSKNCLFQHIISDTDELSFESEEK